MPFTLFVSGFLVVGLCVANVIYQLFFHPLSDTPGPLLARISNIPSFYHTCRGNRHIWLWRCFEIYGDKVRVTPNTVLFNTPTAYNAIYDTKSNIQRSKFYHIFPRNDNDYNTLTTTDVQAHAHKRRLLKLAFTERSNKAASVFVERHVDRWNELRNVKGKVDWSQAEDVAERADFLIFDILGDLCFGKEFNSKELEEIPIQGIPKLITKYMGFQYRLARSPLRNLILWLKPRGLNQSMAACAPKHVKEFYTFVQQSVDQRYALFSKTQNLEKQNSSDRIVPREDMFHFLCAAKDPNTQELAFSKTDLLAEARLLLIAGIDTTSTALSASLFYINQNPDIYKKLVSEIRSTFSSKDQITHGPLLSSCVYLRAVIDETMRMTPAGPSEPERVVRPGGITIDGQFFPAGTLLGVPQWPYYHNETIFSNAWKFHPERWIVSSDNPISNIHAMKRVYSPFTKGVNSCIGQNMALMILSITLARTLWSSDCRIARGTDLGEGRKELGWGRRDRKVYQVDDAFVSLRKGPVLQFKDRKI